MYWYIIIIIILGIVCRGDTTELNDLTVIDDVIHAACDTIPSPLSIPDIVISIIVSDYVFHLFVPW